MFSRRCCEIAGTYYWWVALNFDDTVMLYISVVIVVIKIMSNFHALNLTQVDISNIIAMPNIVKIAFTLFETSILFFFGDILIDDIIWCVIHVCTSAYLFLLFFIWWFKILKMFIIGWTKRLSNFSI